MVNLLNVFIGLTTIVALILGIIALVKSKGDEPNPPLPISSSSSGPVPVSSSYQPPVSSSGPAPVSSSPVYDGCQIKHRQTSCDNTDWCNMGVPAYNFGEGQRCAAKNSDGTMTDNNAALANAGYYFTNCNQVSVKNACSTTMTQPLGEAHAYDFCPVTCAAPAPTSGECSPPSGCDNSSWCKTVQKDGTVVPAYNFGEGQACAAKNSDGSIANNDDAVAMAGNYKSCEDSIQGRPIGLVCKNPAKAQPDATTADYCPVMCGSSASMKNNSNAQGLLLPQRDSQRVDDDNEVIGSCIEIITESSPNF